MHLSPFLSFSLCRFCFFLSHRLWHQLVEKLQAIVNVPFFQKEKRLLALYDNFVEKFSHSLEPLEFVRFCLEVVKQYSGQPVVFFSHVVFSFFSFLFSSSSFSLFSFFLPHHIHTDRRAHSNHACTTHIAAR